MIGGIAKLRVPDFSAEFAAIYARTTDPLVTGEPWNDGSYLRFSAGPVLVWTNSEIWNNANIWTN